MVLRVLPVCLFSPLTLVTLAFFFLVTKGSRWDDGCRAGRGSFPGYNGACVDSCIGERRQARRAAQVPIFYHPPARRHDRARPPGGTEELLASAYVL